MSRNLAENWVVERVEQSQVLGNARSVEIFNHFGDIRTRAAKDDRVSVVSVIQRHKDDPERPRILIHEIERRLVIEVNYPPLQATPLPQDWDKRRVDVPVFVPQATPLNIETLHGRAESKGHKGALEVKTSSGKTLISTQGTVQARSQRGPIQVTYKNRQWNGPSRLQTVTGDIAVFLIEHPDVLATIDTAGDITTDYSVEIRSSPGSSHKRAEARIGAAKHNLELLSAKGSVRLGRIFDLIPTHSRSRSRKTGPDDATQALRNPPASAGADQKNSR